LFVKGIGFKSVFTVTNSPEVHSNSYHIKFDAKTSQADETDYNYFGYIVPIWTMDSFQVHMQKLRQLNHCSHFNMSTTCIHLPLKSVTEREKHKSNTIINSFKDIQSSLLLFLNRLKNLILVNDIACSTSKAFKRVDINENFVQILEIDQNQNAIVKANHWLVNRKKLEIPKYMEKPCDNVDSTDICLAFPLYDDEEQDRMEHLPKVDVYAYLPLRSFNFSFIIQADWNLPASRQDILYDNEWNQWLVYWLFSIHMAIVSLANADT
jgi:hypothetical protein